MVKVIWSYQAKRANYNYDCIHNGTLPEFFANIQYLLQRGFTLHHLTVKNA